MKIFTATYRRINPQLKSGGYETTKQIEAPNLRSATKQAKERGSKCAYGSMKLLSVEEA